MNEGINVLHDICFFALTKSFKNGILKGIYKKIKFLVLRNEKILSEFSSEKINKRKKKNRVSCRAGLPRESILHVFPMINQLHS